MNVHGLINSLVRKYHSGLLFFLVLLVILLVQSFLPGMFQELPSKIPDFSTYSSMRNNTPPVPSRSYVSWGADSGQLE